MKPRLHPLFPTLEEVKDHPEWAYSDHLPLVTKVELGQDTKPLTLISLNILGGAECSGVHPHETQEDQKDRETRHQRIIAGLKKAVARQKADVLFLQEAGDEVTDDLKKALGDTWEIITEFKTGLVTCYSKTRFERKRSQFNRKERIHSLTVEDKLNKNLTLDLHNTWGRYSPFPDGHEACYKELLNNSDSSVSIIFGDTNSRLAPLDDKPGNIITGIIPNHLNQKSGLPPDDQNGDHPDGGFYRIGNKIHQLVTRVLDFEEGVVIETDPRSEEEIKPHLEYRMIMCLDDSYQTESTEINDITVFAYEARLRKNLEKEDLLVRVAADTFNHKAIGIRFPRLQANTPSNDFSFIQKNLNERLDMPPCQFREIAEYKSGKDVITDCLFVPLSHADSLHEVIEQIPNQVRAQKKETLDAIDQQLEALERYRLFMSEMPGKIASLQTLRNQLAESNTQSLDGIKTFTDAWTSQRDEIQKYTAQISTLISDHKKETLLALRRRLDEIKAFHPFLKELPQKIESLETLHNRIENADIQSLDGICKLTETWEKEHSTLEVNGKTLTNSELMGTHRNRFFTPNRPTKTADLLQKIKDHTF